jgi:hypothetical protein
MTDRELVFEYCNYPIIPVKFTSKDQKTPSIEALLDSGGDFIVIPMPIAKYLGLKLKKAGKVDTAGGATTLYKATLTMHIGTKEKYDIYKDLEIHVSTRDDIPILLGRFPIFEDYEITFKKKENSLILKTVKN